MSKPELHVVTGAFGFTGRHITRRLLERGLSVRTLTNRDPAASPFSDRVEAAPLDFDNPRALTAGLRGAHVLYNTYWIRFARGSATHDLAVKNTKTLIRCAADAGVRRLVHVSITNPSENSALSYFRGKAILEQAVAKSGLSYAILRPALLFGPGDVLINNIAWMLRKLPVFAVFGRGDYRVQPVHVDDLADLAVRQAHQDQDIVLDAVGPETFTYRQLIHLIRDTIGAKARIIRLHPRVALTIGRLLGRIVGDVLITREEIDGLMADLLVSHNPPTCPTRFTDWLQDNVAQLGSQYASELSRHYR